ncbi:MAG: SIR2 family protein [Armatimonadetes bacterium]|nr:SIR2 family protein [Armatimonadota bacterium]
MNVTKSSDLDALRTAYRTSNLVLFLGAGVSIAAGAPSWDDLLRRLTYRMLKIEAGEMNESPDPEEMKVLFQYFRHRSPLILARYLKQYFGDRFREEVRQALYGSLSGLHTTELLQEIARLAGGDAADSGVHSMVNYNFDDLLEQTLARRGVEFQALIGPGGRRLPDPLPIYHVQGYLPREEDRFPTSGTPNDLVFSEETYHNQYLNPYSWSNLTQLHLLQEHVGLFVGLSMTDPNLRRLLEASFEQSCDRFHYAIVPTYRAEAENRNGDDSETLEHLEDTRWALALRDLEERVAASLGLRLLWVDRYDLIPQFLASLQQES